MTIHPEFRKQRHREIYHLLRLGDDDRLTLESPKPMTLPAMIPLNTSRPCLTHHQLLWRQDGGIRAPVIGVVDGHLPVGRALDHVR